MNDPATGSDEELIETLSETDGHAIEALADRYAQPIHDFALRATLDPEAAAAVTTDTFLYLKGHSRERPAGVSVRAWLFGYALEQVLAASNDRTRPPDARLSAADRRFTQADPEVDREVALWAWQAARSLRPRDYCVLDLTLRRDLSADELGGSAAQGRGGVYGALGRARGAFTEAYAATALYFRGRDACPELTELVGGSAASLRVGIRRQIAAHVEHCEICKGTIESLPDATEVFAGLRYVDVPSELPPRMLAALATVSVPPAPVAQLSLVEPAEPEEAEAEEEVPGEEAAVLTPEEEFWETTAPADSEPEEDLVEPVEVPAVEAVTPVEPAAGFTPPPRPSSNARYRPASRPGFGPMTGRRFQWSYVLLGVSTAVAIYLGVAVAQSLRSGGGDAGDLPLGSTGLREIPCESGPFQVPHGEDRLIEFNPADLRGFEMKSVQVQPESAQASASALTATVRSGSSFEMRASRIESASARADQYLVQIGWQRDDEQALSDCTVLVPVTAAPAVSPTATP